mmetsp:Transcript_22389/g.41117  ORF Transcript_22389/g.41117 Transcript_22389/m.41117 type:complete len:867 (+) Transcript_22389:243-2843(+)
MRTETAVTAAAFAVAAPFLHVSGRQSRAMALAVVCGVILSICNNDGAVAAFSPPYRTSPPSTSIHDTTSRIAASSAMTTRLSYKHLDDNAEYDTKNETALDNGGEILLNEQDEKVRNTNVKVDVDVSVEINKDLIHYNDLDDPVSISSGSYNASFTSSGQSSSSSDSNTNEGESLTRELEQELETTIEQKNINIDDSILRSFLQDLPSSKAIPKPKAIEPSKTKPSKKFISPIQLIKKVPKVKPIHMSTAFFLELIGDPEWPNQGSTPNKKKPETKKPVIDNWKTKMENQKKSTTFMATDYLETLSANADTKNDKSNQDNEDDKDDLSKRRAQLRSEQQQSQQEAMYEANRRTNPQEAIDKRTEEGEKQRKKKEHEKLEIMYVERKERLDAKKRNEQRYLKEWKRQKEFLEGKARERSEAAAEEQVNKNKKKVPLKPTSRNGKRGIPILDRPFIKALPLLIGSTLTIPYSDLTHFQKRAIDVAREYHQEHCERAKIGKEESELDDPLSKAGEEGGIQAAPIIAVIDGYTAAATAESTTSLTATASSQQPTKISKRYATLASIEVLESTDDEEPSAIKLMGVGRAFLHDYFSSKDAGMTQEEEELSKMLARIHEFDREKFEEELDERHSLEHDDEDDEELPVVMAEFDLLLDDSSILSEEQSTKYGEDVTKHRASSMHAITELYRSTNKVYRLHEERKKLVAGLRAGEARLRLGKGKATAGEAYENCLVEFEDCDGLGLIGWVLDDATNELDTPRSHLETLENYGLGTYGIFSTIPDLTKQLLVHLEPYYSPTHRDREEYEAEVASFVVLKSLEKYASPVEVAEALVVPSTATQRLELGYEIMMRHRNELIELAERISQELMECGEE